MRHGRRKVEVDTFPFLAVLLCAMGALILLLLVMDRRAKIVAQAKARDAAAARSEAASAKRDDAVRLAKQKAEAAWHAEKDKLHAALVLERDGLDRELASAAAALAQAEADLRTRVQGRAALVAETASLAASAEAAEKDAERRRAEIAQVADAARSRAETRRLLHERLSAEVRRLEAELAKTQARRASEPPRYSLVPYGGKQGESRKPIYVEATRDGLVFRPDGASWSPDASEPFRRLVEERTGPLAREPKQPTFAAPEANRPYLLFLVRPDGIRRYYDAIESLRGYRLDYGYELVEAEWAFDFSGAVSWQAAKQDYAPAQPTRPPPLTLLPSGEKVAEDRMRGSPVEGPAFNASPIPGASPSLPTGSFASAGQPLTRPSATLSPEGRGGPNAGPPAGVEVGGTPSVGAFTLLPSGEKVAEGRMRGSPVEGPTFNASPIPGSSSPLPNGSSASAGQPLTRPSATLSPEGRGVPDSTPPPGAFTLLPSGEKVAEGRMRGSPGEGPAFGASPIPGASPPLPNGSSASAGQPLTRPSAALSPEGRGVPDSTPPPGAFTLLPSGEKVAEGRMRGSPAEAPTFGASPGSPNATLSPSPNGSSASAGQPLTRPAATLSPEGRGVPNAGATAGGEGGGGQEVGAMPTFAGPASLAEKPARPSLVGRLLGNRDFILVIDCLEQGAVLTPPGQPFDLREPDAPARLARAVRTLVERRQATVRPGEPPYRPAIQFRVSADGRRTYHAVWPSLAELGIPLMRESTD